MPIKNLFRFLADAKMPEFYDTYDAFIDGNIARLNQLSDESEFPIGRDSLIGRHWLTSAISSQNTASVAWVLNKKPVINYVDDEGATALQWALHIENESQNFPPRSTNGEVKKLNEEQAAQLSIDMINLLLGAGADINLGGTLGDTALHIAAMWSSPKVVRHLLDNGADPFIQNDEYDQQQPADYAKIRKRWDVHAVLCEAMG